MKKYMLLIVLFGFIACDEDTPTSTDDLQGQMNLIYQQIQTTIKLSCSAASECVATPIGVKACGGPTDYLIYSNSTDVSELERLITQYNNLNEELNALTGNPSDCAILNRPTVGCISGSCEVVMN